MNFLFLRYFVSVYEVALLQILKLNWNNNSSLQQILSSLFHKYLLNTFYVC